MTYRNIVLAFRIFFLSLRYNTVVSNFFASNPCASPIMFYFSEDVLQALSPLHSRDTNLNQLQPKGSTFHLATYHDVRTQDG